MEEVVKLLKMAKELEEIAEELRKTTPALDNIFKMETYAKHTTEAYKELRKAVDNLIRATRVILDFKSVYSGDKDWELVQKVIENGEPDVEFKGGRVEQYYVLGDKIIRVERGDGWADYSIAEVRE